MVTPRISQSEKPLVYSTSLCCGAFEPVVIEIDMMQIVGDVEAPPASILKFALEFSDFPEGQTRPYKSDPQTVKLHVGSSGFHSAALRMELLKRWFEIRYLVLTDTSTKVAHITFTIFEAAVGGELEDVMGVKVSTFYNP